MLFFTFFYFFFGCVLCCFGEIFGLDFLGWGWRGRGEGGKGARCGCSKTNAASYSGLVVFGGGLPIRDGQGRMLGAIGVSGGSVDEDIKVAQAGLDGLK